ncbi:PREDICTED: 39S ribosomal protein L2, mitochondrial [Ceratosolen solmsi marchali]|uniref:39S ribosomal protein L2, mitochondrial n=1 Tax=Ceratosolen solmsi marchali TaxID=326594 RepID=A0AAJ6YVF6_9HYME|nr:PREDICTED: 39S ribosomal protein L2, mitochondrial [Ceratosolen solmsi marchali]
MLPFCRQFKQQILNIIRLNADISYQSQQIRNYWKPVNVPKPGVKGKSYRRIVHFKDEYTVEPLEVTNLAGRDPVTGRVVCKGIGGGIKHKYHWINWHRDGPTDLNEKPKEEEVLKVFKDGCRTSYVALVGSGSELKYILATVNMKKGDILKTHKGIPRIPVVASEGDAYPLGALPIGTIVHCIEKFVGIGGFLIHAAGTFGTITSKINDRVIVKVPSKREFNLDQHCMAVVGRVSNEEHHNIPVGSAQKNRELGNRPRSGLWHRKDGRHGRKIRPTPPIRRFDPYLPKSDDTIQLSLNGL